MPSPAERNPPTPRSEGGGSGPRPLPPQAGSASSPAARCAPSLNASSLTSSGASSGAPPRRASAHRDGELPPRTRRILHLDIDAFLASVEQAEHPELRGKPVVVGGLPHERNLVMSSSYEARAFGVRPGMRLFEAARLCPRAIFRRGDSQAANRRREAVTRILLSVSPRIEVASIDDFFVDLTGATRALGAACDVAAELRVRIRKEVDLPATIGVGTSKTMARLAGKLAKPGGVGEVLPGRELAFLRPLPIEFVPGAGSAIGRMLERFAIRTCGEFALATREIVYASFGLPGLVLHERARGIDREPVETTHALAEDGTLTALPPKSIRRDSTFEPEEGRREVVEAMLAYLVERATHKLREHRQVAKTLAVRIVYVDTRPANARRADPDGPGREEEKRKTLSRATDSTVELTQLARALLKELPRRRALVKRVGLTLSSFTSAQGWQGTLFDESADEPGERVTEPVERAHDPGEQAAAPRAGPNGAWAHANGRFERDSTPSAPMSAESSRGERLRSRADHVDTPEERATPSDSTAASTSSSRFSPTRTDRHRAVDAVLDELRAKHGFGRVLRGASFFLANEHELGPDGFRLRTPSLNQ
ncbi:MAG: DNA polymerase IV [Planctomycetes bacterium]|nr:DNA polymerase IV [Planctomycetota bacterium]